MKTYKKVLLGIAIAVGLAVIVALPFGVKFIQEEGWEGVWKMKRETVGKSIPESKPLIDEAEKKAKNLGLGD